MKSFAALLAVALATAAWAAGTGGNYGWLSDTPVSKFNKDDKKLMREAAAEVIGAQPGFTRSWENPATGNGGTLTLLAVFEAPDGRPCRQLRVQNHAKGLSGDSKVSICKHPSRGWLLDTEEPPGN